jgi:biopolymer transport protein ExbB/TolQ
MFWISNGLLVPVIVGLLFFFCQSILMIGSLYNQYLQRKKQHKILKIKLLKLDNNNLSDLEKEIEQSPQNEWTKTISQLYKMQNSLAHRDLYISEFEMKAQKSISKAKILVKFGPILGLMGTLIPMGPALVGLSTGNIESMAYNMQVAFATTVLGLLTGAIGYILLQFRQKWANEDLTQLDFISNLMSENQKNTLCEGDK